MKKNYNLFSWRKTKKLMIGLLTVAFTSLSYGQIATNNFDTDLGWTVNHTTGTSTNDGWTRVTSGTNPTIATAPVGAGMAKFSAYNINSGDVYELNSPAMTFAGGSYQVTFKMYRDVDYANNADKIEVFYNTVEGSTGGTSLGTVNRSTSLAPVVSGTGWNDYVFNIPNNPSGDGYISFVATSAYGNNIYIDEIVVEEVPSCSVPLGVAHTVISSSTVDVTWTEPSSVPSGGYDVYYSTDATAPDATTTPSFTGITGSSQSITGLSPSTDYFVWVRSNCGADGTSAWTSVYTFNISYCESVPTSNDNDGITNTSINGTNFAGSDVMYQDHTATVVDIAASTQVTVDISFATGYTYGTNIWIDLNNNYAFEDSELLYSGESTADNPTTLNASFNLAANAPVGQHRMRIGTADSGQATPNPCYSGGYGVTLDFIINVTEAPACQTPLNAVTADVTQTSATVSWTAPASVPANGYDVYYSTDATAPDAATTPNFEAVSATTQALTGLTENTMYYVWVRSNCGSDWVQTSFTTLPLPPSCATVTATPDASCGTYGLVFTWDAVADATGYKLTIGTTAGGNDVLDSSDLGNVTTYTLSSSIASTTYYYTLVPYNTGGDTTGCAEESVTTIDTQCYCASVPTSNDRDGITNTAVNGTSFAGTDVTYQDHTATAVDAAQGSEVTVDITFATGYTYNTHIWVDLNDDYIFSDNELLYSGESTATNPTTLNATFTLAADAALGQHRMRIGTADHGQATPNACYSDTYGVTVDATINVTETLATQEVNVRDLKGVQIYPNPFLNVVMINDIKGIEKISIVDMAGRLVKTLAPANELNLGDLKSGLYLINLSYEDGSVKTVKAIKK